MVSPVSMSRGMIDVLSVTGIIVLLSSWISLEAKDTEIKTDTDRVFSACNVSINDTFLYEPVTVELPTFDNSSGEGTIYCLYTFTGTESHRISIRVTELNVGYYNNSRDNGCEEGYLKIWDGSITPGRHRSFPNTFCGCHSNDDAPIHRVSTGSDADVAFYASDLTQMPAMKFTASYLKVVQDVNLQSKEWRHSMTSFTNTSSGCEWDQDIEHCDYECPILSPGYPGIYPPNSKCSYHAFSRNPYVTFKLKATGFTENRKLREFNLRRDCSEHYVDVYDAPSTRESRHVGRFCGENFPNITTSSNSIYIVFSSGTDAPPYNYNGFHIGVTAVTKEWHQDGVQIPDSLCNWVFNATVGSVSSPEHWLPRKTTCEYGFNVHEGNYLKFILNIYGLQPNCADYIQIMDGEKIIAKLCDQNVQETKESFIFNVTSVFARIRYFISAGQMEGQEAKGFWLSFRQIQDPTSRIRTTIAVTDKPTDKAQPVIRYAYDDSKSNSVQNTPITALISILLFQFLAYCKTFL